MSTTLVSVLLFNRFQERLSATDLVSILCEILVLRIMYRTHPMTQLRQSSQVVQVRMQAPPTSTPCISKSERPHRPITPAIRSGRGTSFVDTRLTVSASVPVPQLQARPNQQVLTIVPKETTALKVCYLCTSPGTMLDNRGFPDRELMRVRLAQHPELTKPICEHGPT